VADAALPRLGLTTRFVSHVGLAPLAFWETKAVAGARRPLPAGAVPSVSAFADDAVARAHPDWVQVGPGGVRAVRGAAPYFDWAHLCPSRPEVVALADAWVEEAVRSQAGAARPALRLSDVGFAREGYCACGRCAEEARRRGLDREAYRRAVAAEAIERWRRRLGPDGRLFLTLYPDPYPGHLERRFGLDPDRLRPSADAFVVPLYDLAYATTHWLETLAQGFADRLGGHPWYAELYALGVEPARLERAARVALAYAHGVLFAYGRDGGEVAALVERLAGA
jgi:hypothetical protein